MNDPDMIDEVQSIGKFADTDHHEMLYWEVRFRTEKTVAQPVSVVRDYTKADYGTICNQLQNVKWDDFFQHASIEQA